MKLHLKNLPDQVLVITGASSGIGLVTAGRVISAMERKAPRLMDLALESLTTATASFRLPNVRSGC